MDVMDVPGPLDAQVSVARWVLPVLQDWMGIQAKRAQTVLTVLLVNLDCAVKREHLVRQVPRERKVTRELPVRMVMMAVTEKTARLESQV